MKKQRIISLIMMLVFALANITAMNVSAKNVVEDPGFEVPASRDDLIISTPVYKSGDNVISAIGAAQDITAEVKIIKTTSGTGSAALFAALYDEGMNLKKAEFGSCDLTGNGTENTACVSLTTPEDANSNYTLRCFVWENENSIAPYTQAFELKNPTVDNAWTVSGDWKVVSKSDNSNYWTKNGFASLAQINSSAGDTSGEAFQWVNVKPQTSYLLSYYINMSQNASFNCVVTTEDGTELLNKNYSAGSLIRDSLHTGDNTKIKICFKDTCSTDSDRAYIDRVSLDENLLTDGDFDNGTLIDWGEKQNNNSSALSLDTSVKQSGNASLYVNGGRANQLVGADKLAEYGAGVYTVSGWIRDNGTGAIFFRVWKAGSYNDNSASTVEKSDGWKYFSKSYYLSENDIKNQVEVNPFSTSGTYWIDNVSLTKSDRKDAFDDYGFESADTAKAMNKCNVSETFSIDSAVSHSGETSLKVDKQNQGYAGIKYIVPSTDLARYGAGKYKLSGWMKYTNADNCLPVVKLFANNTEIASTTTPVANVNEEKGFKYFECVADISDVSQTIDFRFYTTMANTDAFWVDDVHFERIGDVTPTE